MKIISLILLSLITIFSQTFASESCFIAKEKGKVLKNEGDCQTAYGPQCTFNIALSLIGFDIAVLKSVNDPLWSLPISTEPYISICKDDHNPRTWMRDSCVWYSQVLTNKLGIEKFQNYVNNFSYGNMNLSGGLTNAWISSSLKISPDEQTVFLQKIIDRKFSLNSSSYDETKKIMFIQEMAGGWKLYGKTGNGSKIDAQGNKTDLQQGWFIGYIEKDNRQIVFASHIVDCEKQSVYASFRARNEALNKLWYIIEDIEK